MSRFPFVPLTRSFSTAEPSATVYNVWPWGINDPVSGKRKLIESPHDTVASPAGWHAVPGKSDVLKASIPGVSVSAGWTNTTTTLGNNVYAQEDWDNTDAWALKGRPVNSSLNFDYEYGGDEGLRPKE